MKTLIVVHGMGTHSEDSLRTEITAALNAVFQTYESLVGSEISDHFNLVPVEYDSYFEAYREAIGDREDVLNAMQEVRGDWPLIPRAAAEIARLEQSLLQDEFFNTHWLDVLLYRFTLISEPIRLKLAEATTRAVAEQGSSDVHVLGTSLGTSIVHDTLAKLYGPEPGDFKLSNSADKLGGVHMVANVSRVLQTFRKVGASEVRPGSGCCAIYYEYRHKLDPFTKVKPFDPTDNGEWVTHSAWRRGYRLYEPTGVTDANVHALSHYLKNPEVHLPLFRQVFRFRPLANERNQARQAYEQQTLQHKAIAVREAFEEFNFSIPSVQNLLGAGKEFKDIVEQIGDAF